MKDERLQMLSRIIQLSFIVIIAVEIVLGRYEWIPSAALSLFITFVPNLIKRRIRLTLPPELTFIIFLALFLHTMGGSLGLYMSISWWDHLTHSFSAFLVASLGFIGVVIIDKYADSIYLPPKFLAFFIFMLTSAFGVIWEISEFANDQLTGSTMQYSLDDTMVDLMFDIGGGLVIAVLGPFYLLGTSEERFLQEMNIEEAISEIRSKI